MNGVVVDTSPFIDLERKNLPISHLLQSIEARFGVVQVVMSPITVAELEHGVHRAKTAEQRDLRRRHFEDTLEAVPVLAFTTRTARIVGRINAEAKLRGWPLPYLDMLIAGTALEVGFDLLTGNVRDFRKIPELRVHEFRL